MGRAADGVDATSSTPPATSRPGGPLRTWRWPRTTAERVWAAILAVMIGTTGAVFTGLCVSDHHTAQALAARGLVTTATITATTGEGKFEEPTLVFVTSTGRRIRDTDGATDDLHVGDRVRVLYDASDPRDYVVDATARQDADSYLVDAALAVPLLAVAAFQLTRALHPRRTPDP